MFKPTKEAVPTVRRGTAFDEIKSVLQKSPGESFRLAEYENPGSASSMVSNLRGKYTDEGFGFVSRGGVVYGWFGDLVE